MASIGRRDEKRDDPAPTLRELLRMGVESFVATLVVAVVVYGGYLAIDWLRQSITS